MLTGIDQVFGEYPEIDWDAYINFQQIHRFGAFEDSVYPILTGDFVWEPTQWSIFGFSGSSLGLESPLLDIFPLYNRGTINLPDLQAWHPVILEMKRQFDHEGNIFVDGKRVNLESFGDDIASYFGENVNLSSRQDAHDFADRYPLTNFKDIALLHWSRNILHEPIDGFYDIVKDPSSFIKVSDAKNAFHKFDDFNSDGINDSSGNAGNFKWISVESGNQYSSEYIFDTDFNLVTDSVNAGSLNIYSATALGNAGHFDLDVQPWIAFGNVFGDTTTVSVRNGTGVESDLDYVSRFSNSFVEFGTSGDDTWISGRYDDDYRGGLGTDTVRYIHSDTGIAVNLEVGLGFSGDAAFDDNFETLSSIENIEGSSHSDIIIGSNADNTLFGGAGSDTLEGGGGNDTLQGGNGTDVAIYVENENIYTIRRVDDDIITISSGSETDTLQSIESIQFANVTVQAASIGYDSELPPFNSAPLQPALPDQTTPTYISLRSTSNSEGEAREANFLSFRLDIIGPFEEEISFRVNTYPQDGTTGADYYGGFTNELFTLSSDTPGVVQTGSGYYYDIRIPIYGDTVPEKDYAMSLEVSDVSGAQIFNGSSLSATGRITNDDDFQQLSFVSQSQTYALENTEDGYSKYFYFETAGSGRLAVDIKGMTRNVDLEILDYLSNPLGYRSTNSGLNDERVEFSYTHGQGYFIKVDGLDATQRETFDLEISFLEGDRTPTTSPSNGSADLLVSQVSYGATTISNGGVVGQTFLPGDDVSFNYDVLNQGSARAGLSDTVFVGTGALGFTNSSQQTRILQPGEDVSYTTPSFRIPENIANGQYVVGFGVDADGDVFEGDGEENNVFRFWINVDDVTDGSAGDGIGGGENNALDLVLNSAQIDDSIIEQGDRPTLNLDISNVGGDDTNATQIGYYRSETPNFSDAVFLNDRLLRLDAGQSTENSIGFLEEWTNGLNSGQTYYFFAVLNYDLRGSETNFSNNRSGPIEVMIQGATSEATRQDYVFSRFEFSDTVINSGGTPFLVYRIENLTEAPDNQARVLITLSEDGVYGNADDVVLSDSRQSVNGRDTIYIPTNGLELGDYTVFGEVDYDQRWLETDDTNNLISQTISIVENAPEGVFNIRPTVNETFEGDSGDLIPITFEVERRGGQDGSVNVDWQVQSADTSIADGSGSRSGTVFFADGDGAAKSIVLYASGDAAEGFDKAVSVQISSRDGEIGNTQGTVTVVDDDFVAENTEGLSGDDVALYAWGGSTILTVGDTASLIVDLVNQGGAVSNGSSILEAFVSRDAFYSPDDLRVFSETTSGIQAGEIRSYQADYAVPDVDPGDHYIVYTLTDLATGSVLAEVNNSVDIQPSVEDSGVVLFGDEFPGLLFGGEGNDMLVGTSSDDFFFGTEGNDLFIGNEGIDWATYSGNQANFTLSLSPLETSLTDRRSDTSDTDTLVGIEVIGFDNESFSLEQFGSMAVLGADQLESFTELYIAYFNRAPDAIGLNFWGTAYANGTSLEEMATLFIDQDETRAAYPSFLSNTDFATAVYANVLGRIADQEGFDFWVDVLNAGDRGRDQFILEVLRGAKAETPADATSAFIIQQQADREYLSTKTDIGAYFSVHKGMSDVSNASAAMALFDGTAASVGSVVAAIDNFYASALDPINGEFLMPLVGVLDDPFSV